jgi:cytoskeletal protein RodZ
MDLRLYARVLRRFWPVVAAGVVLAVVLSFVSFFRVHLESSPHVTYRQHETWKGTETLFLTQPGFPWGRGVYPYTLQGKGSQQIPTAPYADPGRFNALAVFYSELADSDAVRSRVFGTRPREGSYTASPVVKSLGGELGSQPVTQIVPLVQIDALAHSPERAVAIARRASTVFRAYLGQSQVQARIPTRQRVVVEVLTGAKQATLSHGRRLTLPIVVFLGTLIATLFVAFALENLRPRPQTADPAEDAGSAGDAPPVPPDAGIGQRPSSEPVPHGWPPASERLVPARASTARPKSLGRHLRETRLRQDLDLPGVEAKIDVQTKFLRALEGERYDLFPSAEAAKDALSRYARHLKLDPGSCLDAFDAAASAAPSTGADQEGRLLTGNGKVSSMPITLLVIPLAASILLLARGGSPDRAVASLRSPDAATRTERTAFVASRATRTQRAPLARRPQQAGDHVRLAVTAARGDSWLVVKVGSAEGRVLFSGILRQGRTLRLTAQRLWVRLGAAANLDVGVNGSRPHAELYGTLDALVTAAGFRKVPLAQ